MHVKYLEDQSPNGAWWGSLEWEVPTDRGEVEALGTLGFLGTQLEDHWSWSLTHGFHSRCRWMEVLSVEALNSPIGVVWKCGEDGGNSDGVLSNNHG
ncbi:hypothetical protein TNCV_634351 [Trichonephila clavipes]|nr:hypothetical protein TNCV_634351 [Trichonephila clavipes]